MLRPAFLPFMLVLGWCVLLAPAAPVAPAGQAAIDLSSPVKTYETFLKAKLADDLPTMVACITMPDAKKKMMETLVKYDMARHKLETAALAKFGPDASKAILDTTRPIRDELQAQQKRLIESRPDIERDGTTAVLFLRAERDPPPGVEPFSDGIHFVKVGEQWKIDAVRFFHQEDPGDPDLAKQQAWGVALFGAIGEYMTTLTADITKGTYQNASQVREALNNKWDKLGEGNPSGAPPADTAPAAEPGNPGPK